jgi:CIC family chloride channel protein
MKRPIYVLNRLFWSSETAVLTTLALLIGVGAGFGAIFFRWLIGFFHTIAFDGGQNAFSFMDRYYVILIPAIGGLAVGIIVNFVGKETKGHGVPEVMEAVALRGGRIRPIIVLGKCFASSIAIGTGGSVGREGPIVQIGSAFGSTIGQIFRLSDRRICNLVACGAAGGIAATFNAPIAGVVFALEVILLDFTLHTFSTIVIASVTATVISRMFLGDVPAFIVPEYSLVSPWELLLYLLLGLIAGFVALLYVRTLYKCEDFFDSIDSIPGWIKPAIGGLIVGSIGVYLPQVFGVGYEAIELSLAGKMGLGLLAILVIAKILATSITIGSGSSGGIFAPSLFIGAMLGGAFGMVANMWFPEITAHSGAYALVAMAAIFAGAAKAPICSILILFEMTQDYRIILPLMFATVVSTVVADLLDKDSIYTHKLRRRGVDFHFNKQKDLELLSIIRVEEAMEHLTDSSTIPYDMPVEEVEKLFHKTFLHDFMVVDKWDKLYGIITPHDLDEVPEARKPEMTVADVCTTEVMTAYPDDTLEDVMRRFGAMDIGRLPVVDRVNPRRILGTLRWRDIVRSYSYIILDHGERRDRMELMSLQHAAGSHLNEIVLTRNSAAAGKCLHELVLPPNTVIVSIRRGRRIFMPEEDTRLKEGDRIVALAAHEAEKKLKKYLHQGGNAEGV